MKGLGAVAEALHRSASARAGTSAKGCSRSLEPPVDGGRCRGICPRKPQPPPVGRRHQDHLSPVRRIPCRRSVWASPRLRWRRHGVAAQR